MRVNERGDGDITAAVLNSVFVDNGADGFELDEEGAGDATLTALGSTFDDNGATRVGGDDGLDIDESDDGSIWLNVVGSTFNGSTDDGIGLDESGSGDLHITLVQVEASANVDSGISADEGDAGNYEAKFVLVTADENEDKGADMTEAGDGDYDGRAVTSSFSFNGDDGDRGRAAGCRQRRAAADQRDDRGQRQPGDRCGRASTSFRSRKTDIVVGGCSASRAGSRLGPPGRPPDGGRHWSARSTKVRNGNPHAAGDQPRVNRELGARADVIRA